MTKIREEVAHVTFKSGCFAYVGVSIYEGKSYEECLKLRDGDIDGYFKGGKYHRIEEQG